MFLLLKWTFILHSLQSDVGNNPEQKKKQILLNNLYYTIHPVGIRILFLIPTRICFNCVFSSQLKIKLSVLFR